MEDLRELYVHSSTSNERKKYFKDTSEVAKQLDISESRIRQMIHDGTLRAVKVSGRYYVYGPSVMDLIEEV